MQGSWVVASGESGGNALPDEQAKAARFVIKGDKYVYTIPDYREEGTLKADSSKKPKAIDVKIVEGQDQGETQLGIYDLSKDTLKLCFAPGKDNKRPKDFSTNAENDQLLLVLKREKS